MNKELEKDIVEIINYELTLTDLIEQLEKTMKQPIQTNDGVIRTECIFRADFVDTAKNIKEFIKLIIAKAIVKRIEEEIGKKLNLFGLTVKLDETMSLNEIELRKE